MKKFLAVVLMIFTISIIINNTYKPASASAVKDKLVRFHVIANSDSEVDQRVKLKVRDAILKKVGSGLEGTSTQEESLIYLGNKLEEIERIANDILKKEGKAYRSKAMIGDYEFPVKNYNNITLPAGEYKALRVVLGNGDGKNWWCVMFPPLCFIDITRGYTEEKTDTELQRVLSKNEIESITAFKGEEEKKEAAQTITKNTKQANPVEVQKPAVKESPKPESKVEFRFKSIELIKSAFNKLRISFNENY